MRLMWVWILALFATAIGFTGCAQDQTCWAPGQGQIGQGGTGPVIQWPTGGFGEDTSGADPEASGCPKTETEPKPVDYICRGVVDGCVSTTHPDTHGPSLCLSGEGISPYSAEDAKDEALANCAGDLDDDFADGAPWLCLGRSQLVCATRFRYRLSFSIPCYDAAAEGDVSGVCERTSWLTAAPSCNDAYSQAVSFCVQEYRNQGWSKPACPTGAPGVKFTCNPSET